MYDNIETIHLEKYHDFLDMEIFDRFAENFELQKNIAKETKARTEDGIRNVILKAGLAYVDFTVNNTVEFQKGLIMMDNHLHDFSLSGHDDEYSYVLNVCMQYRNRVNGPELQPPVNILMNIMRESKTHDFAIFNFQTETWDSIKCMEATGFTETQCEILQQNNIKAGLLKTYKAQFGKIYDDDFEKLCKTNKAIMDLYKRTNRFAKLIMADKEHAALTNIHGLDGSMITFSRGLFCLNISLKSQIIKTVYKTGNIEQIQNIAEMLYDRIPSPLTFAVVPLSGDAFADLCRNNQITVFRKDKENRTNDEEKEILESYLKKAKQASD